MVQITKKNDETVTQGTSRFDTMKEAVSAFHVAIASAMSKVDVSKFTCVILNENGLTQKIEVYENIPDDVVGVDQLKERVNMFIKRLFCKHDYQYTHQHMINGGMGKIKYCKCNKCGKIKLEFI